MDRYWKICVTLTLTGIFAVGCVNETPAGEDKDEARRLTQSRADLGRDLCEAFGWYDDDECDEFCPRPDPDCGTMCTSDDECAPIFCIRAPCPVNECVDGECQVRGRTDDCPDLSVVRCGWGTEIDEFGCEVCAAPPECSPVLCELYCPYGFVDGADGCPICRCADPPGGEMCTTDLECPQPLCLPGGPCPRNVCVDGECVSEDRAECASDLDCPMPSCLPGGPCPEIACVDGECVDVSERDCVEDSDCPVPLCLPGGPCPTPVCTDDGMCEYRDEGSLCDSSADCTPGEYCDGGCDAPGTCTPYPVGVVCTAVITEYCDCDGNTRYSSSGCVFDRYSHRGACAPPPDCRSTGCGDGNYCSFCWGNWACIPNGAVC